MRDMVRRDILPAVCRYMDAVANTAIHKRQVCKTMPCKTEELLLERLSALSDQLYEQLEWLEKSIDQASGFSGELIERARFSRDGLIQNMNALRSLADELETLTGAEYWPYPSYSELLYSV